MQDREFLKRLEQFKAQYQHDLTPAEMQRCVNEALRDNAVFKAYVCASEILVRKAKRRKGKPRLEREKAKEEVEAEEVAEEAKPETKTEFAALTSRLPWQAYAGFAVLILALIHPLSVLLALPIIALLYVAVRNTMPLWTEGDMLVWEGKRLRFFEVERVFRDVNGMGPHEFSNILITTTHTYNGIYYHAGKVWILLEDGADAEEARRVLRRFGVVVKPEPSPPPITLPREKPGKYLPWAFLPLLSAAASPAAIAASVLPIMLIIMLTMRDVGHRPRPPLQPLTRDVMYFSMPDSQSIHAIARAAQPLIEEALVVWAVDPEYALRLEKAGSWAERWAWWKHSQWAIQRLEVMQVARQRILNLREKGFLVNGLIKGKTAAFSTGRPATHIEAFTRDLAEFTPYALLLAPTECKEASVVLGTDDAGRTVCLNPEELQTPHMIVIGKTGAGKTTLGINIAIQLRRKRGVAPVIIDPHGHWAMLAKWLPDVQIVDARQHMPPLRLTDEDDVDLLLDILRAAGIQIFDAHFTVLLEALRRAAQEKDTSYRNILKNLEALRRDPAFAFAIDSILGRLATLAHMRMAKVDLSKPLVVHTSGDTSPSSTMKLVSWIIWLVTEAKATCPNPPCKMRLYLVVDEGHILMKNTLVLSRTWREHRKFGVEAAVFTQSIAEIPQDLIENSGVKVVLAIEPEAVPHIEQRLHVDRTVVERVAYESLPEERVGIIRVEGRAPIYVRLTPPEHR
ncbi:MAG: helicase HerA domain-containing protein [Pyrobaculum sp.]|jgi:hypothetical protein